MFSALTSARKSLLMDWRNQLLTGNFTPVIKLTWNAFNRSWHTHQCWLVTQTSSLIHKADSRVSFQFQSVSKTPDHWFYAAFNKYYNLYQPCTFTLFCPFRLHFHDACTDPLGWTSNPPFTVDQFTAEDLIPLIKQTSHHKPATLVVDSLSWILRHHKPSAVCKTLQQLRKGDVSWIFFFTFVVGIVFLNQGTFSWLCWYLFIRGSCESNYWSAPCRYASSGHCGKSVPLGYMCHHCCTWCQRRWNSGEDNKALKIWESHTRCNHFIYIFE